MAHNFSLQDPLLSKKKRAELAVRDARFPSGVGRLFNPLCYFRKLLASFLHVLIRAFVASSPITEEMGQPIFLGVSAAAALSTYQFQHVTSSFLLLVAMPRATRASLLLVGMPFQQILRAGLQRFCTQ